MQVKAPNPHLKFMCKMSARCSGPGPAEDSFARYLCFRGVLILAFRLWAAVKSYFEKTSAEVTQAS
jgi:hypothetical protein